MGLRGSRGVRQVDASEQLDVYKRQGKNVIIVEDIVDSGTTLNYLKAYLQNHDAKCCLLYTSKVTFPEEYHAADLAGKEAVFKCKVHEIKEEELPEINDEFVKDVSEFDTMDELDVYKRQIYGGLKNFLQNHPDWSLFLVTTDKDAEEKILQRKAEDVYKRQIVHGYAPSRIVPPFGISPY